MIKNFVPGEILILLELHCFGEAKKTLNNGFTFYKETIIRFRKEEIINEYYQITPKGRALISLIMCTPWPQPVWVDERSGEIIPND